MNRLGLIRLAPLIFALLPMTACVTPIPLDEQTPDAAYALTEPLIVAVVDQRLRVVDSGKPRTFVGVAHGTFGIPSDWHVKQVLATEEGDKERDLAQFLTDRIVVGFNEGGSKAVGAELLAEPTEAEAKALLAQHRASTLLVLVLYEWYFSINLNWVTAFNFDTDASVVVHQLRGGELINKRFTERDVIDEGASESAQNNVLRAYRDQLAQIVNDDEVRAALTIQ